MLRRGTAVVSLVLVAALAVPSAAQGGGFVGGELFLYSPAIQGISSNSGALVRIDLAGGTATILVDTVDTPQSTGAVAFDPYRQRVLFCGGFPLVSSPKHLWAVDGAGQTQDLGFAGKLVASLAPTGDGRVYLTDSVDLSAPLKYLDAAGIAKPLLDASGTASYFINGLPTFNVRGMIFDSATNALFVANTTPCPGGVAGTVNVTKLPLSADGARVVGPESCAQFDVSTSGEVPVGWSRGPAGQLVLVVDSNAGGVEPHILLVDPATLGITVFATPGGFFGAPALNAGTWSSSLSKVILLETLTDVLRAFGAGESGAGTTLAIVGAISAGGSSGETATLIEVPPSACEGAWLAYGAGLAGKGGAVPTLTGAGCPQIGGAFSLQLAHGVGSATGTLFTGLASASVPFKGGNFLVGAVVLQVVIGLGGPPGVADAGALTLPAGLPPDPLLVGVSVFLQAGFSDAAAVKGVSLTQGLEMEIG